MRFRARLRLLVYRLERGRAYARCDTPRERLELVASEMLGWYDEQVVLFSRQLADELRVWSEPVQLRIEPSAGSMISDVVARTSETELV